MHIKGETVWSGVANIDVADAQFRSCPIAEINQGATHDIMTLHRRLQIQGVALSDVLDRPTAAALDGLAAIASEVAEVQSDRAERAKRDAAARSKSKARR